MYPSLTTGCHRHRGDLMKSMRGHTPRLASPRPHGAGRLGSARGPHTPDSADAAAPCPWPCHAVSVQARARPTNSTAAHSASRGSGPNSSRRCPGPACSTLPVSILHRRDDHSLSACASLCLCLSLALLSLSLSLCSRVGLCSPPVVSYGAAVRSMMKETWQKLGFPVPNSPTPGPDRTLA